MATYRIVGDAGTGPKVIASGLDDTDAQAAFHTLVASLRVEPDPDHLTEADGYDFLELVVFAAKVENEGFPYAFEHYGPVFRRADLKVLENNAEAFEDFYDAHAEAIDQWWDDHEDADDLYDAHLIEHDQEKARRRAEAAEG